MRNLRVYCKNWCIIVCFELVTIHKPGDSTRDIKSMNFAHLLNFNPVFLSHRSKGVFIEAVGVRVPTVAEVMA